MSSIRQAVERLFAPRVVDIRVVEQSPHYSIVECLASVQHEIWAHWMSYLFSVCEVNDDGSVTIPADKVWRWSRQVSTDYNGLSESEKDSDREQAAKVISALDDIYRSQREALFPASLRLTQILENELLNKGGFRE